MWANVPYMYTNCCYINCMLSDIAKNVTSSAITEPVWSLIRSGLLDWFFFSLIQALIKNSPLTVTCTINTLSRFNRYALPAHVIVYKINDIDSIKTKRSINLFCTFSNFHTYFIYHSLNVKCSVFKRQIAFHIEIKRQITFDLISKSVTLKRC